MDASGSGSIETQVHTSAAHTGITHEFRIDLATDDDLFKAFVWADANTEGAVDASSGQTDFTITLDQVKFEARLAHVIFNAEGGAAAAAFSVSTNINTVAAAKAYANPSNLGAAAPTAQNILDREIRLEVEAELDTNGVLEYLEGDSLGNFSLVLDGSGGAADMYGKLSAPGPLRNLFLQFPNRTTVYAETDVSGNLPVEAGDAVSFVFNVSPSVKIAEVNQSETSGAGESNAVSNALGTTDMVLNNSTNLSTAPRKIVFTVDVTEA
jgi:hypothetical protein